MVTVMCHHRHVRNELPGTYQRLNWGNAAVGAADVPPMTDEFIRRAERTPVTGDADTDTAQVVNRMCALINDAARKPEFERFARQVVNEFRGGPAFASTGGDPLASPAAIAESAWWWCKSHLKFVHHSKLMRWYKTGGDGYQLLIAPDVVLAALQSPSLDIRQRGSRGDCAIYTMMCCAILAALGCPYEVVTTAVDPNEPGVYSHVFCYAVLGDGRRMPIDASHGKYAGWSVPLAHRTRTQVWSLAGRPTVDRSSRFGGLHAYMRGMGQDDFDTLAAQIGITSPDPMTVYNPSTSAPSTFDSGAFFGSLANQWTTIASRMLAPSTTYQRNADGSISLVTPGSSPVLAGSVLSGGNALGSSSSSLLLYGGLAVGAILLVSMMGKK